MTHDKTAAARKIDAAMAELRSDRPTHICGHLIAGDFRRLLCVDHPASGLLCPDCAGEHRQTHGQSAACDFCGREGVGEPVEEPHAVETPEAVAVTHPKIGTDRLVNLRHAGPVALWGLYACDECRKRG